MYVLYYLHQDYDEADFSLIGYSPNKEDLEGKKAQLIAEGEEFWAKHLEWHKARNEHAYQRIEAEKAFLRENKDKIIFTYRVMYYPHFLSVKEEVCSYYKSVDEFIDKWPGYNTQLQHFTLPTLPTFLPFKLPHPIGRTWDKNSFVIEEANLI